VWREPSPAALCEHVGLSRFFERVVVPERSPVYQKSSVGQRGCQLRRQRFEKVPVVVKYATEVVGKLDNTQAAGRQTQHK
jgi:hypothetical protein